MTPDDVYWGLYQEHTSQGRHHEEQRSTVTNLIIAIAAGILGLFALDQAPSAIHLLLAVFLFALGAFGALFTAKHYERFNMHMQRARRYRDEVDATVTDRRVAELKRIADGDARRDFPVLFGLRLFWFWIGLHLLIALIGLVLAGWVLCGMCG